MIFTSYYAKYKGSRGVSVSKKTPSWAECDECPQLMPDWALVQSYKAGEITWKEFRKAYIKQLKALDVKWYHNILDGKVLLCWETPDKHCHREIIREWFNRNGFACEELEAPYLDHTCAYCKELDNHHGSHIFCTKTGEIFTNAQQQAKTCEDWRNH